MLTLYEGTDFPHAKVLYDIDNHRVIAQYEKFKLGWIMLDDLGTLEQNTYAEYFESVLKTMQRNGIGTKYTTTNYDTWEDFVIDQL